MGGTLHPKQHSIAQPNNLFLTLDQTTMKDATLHLLTDNIGACHHCLELFHSRELSMGGRGETTPGQHSVHQGQGASSRHHRSPEARCISSSSPLLKYSTCTAHSGHMRSTIFEPFSSNTPPLSRPLPGGEYSSHASAGLHPQSVPSAHARAAHAGSRDQAGASHCPAAVARCASCTVGKW